MKVVVGSRHVTLAYLSLQALTSHDLQRLKEIRYVQDMFATTS